MNSETTEPTNSCFDESDICDIIIQSDEND